MNIVIDTNIIFSAILKFNDPIGDLIFNSEESLSFHSPKFLQDEIEEHWSKLKKISKLSEDDLRQSQSSIYQQIDFHNEKKIPSSIWKQAEAIVKNIDEDDVAFVALTMHLNGLLWSKDRPLIRGLKKAGFKNVVSTADLVAIRRGI